MKIDTRGISVRQGEARKSITHVLARMDKLSGFSRVSPPQLDSDARELFVRAQPDASADLTLWTARCFGVQFIYEPTANLAFAAPEGLLTPTGTSKWLPLTDSMIASARGRTALSRLRALLSEWCQWQLQPSLLSGSKVRAVSVNFAARCNLSCGYCFNDRGTYGRTIEQRLNAESVPQLLDFLLHDTNLADEVQVICFGGEPLLAAQSIRAMVHQYEERPAPKRRLTFSINTNGVLLKGEVVSLLDTYFDSVGVSIDLDQARHDEARPFVGGAKSFDLIRNNLARLPQSLKNKVSLEIVLTDPNVDFDDYEQRVQQMGLRYADFGPVQGSQFAMRWNNQEVDRYVDNIENFYARRIGRFSATGLRMISVAADALLLRFGRPITRKCGAGRQVVSVGSDGKIGGCWALQGRDELHFGDVLGDVAFDRSRMRDYDALLNPQQDQICRGCNALNICGGHCSAMRLFDESFRNRCHYLRRMSMLYVALRHSMSQEDIAYVRSLHYDH